MSTASVTLLDIHRAHFVVTATWQLLRRSLVIVTIRGMCAVNATHSLGLPRWSLF